MAMGQSVPDSPPVQKLVPGHLYYIEKDVHSGVFEYLGRTKNKRNRVFHKFLTLACTKNLNGKVSVGQVGLRTHMIKEIFSKDLPLYINLLYIAPEFDELLKRGTA